MEWEDKPPAGTVQRVKHGDVPSIEITLRQVEAAVDAFGGYDAEVSIVQRPDAWPHVNQVLYAYFTEYPGEGTIYLGRTEIDDHLAANGHTPAAPFRPDAIGSAGLRTSRCTRRPTSNAQWRRRSRSCASTSLG